MDNQKMMKAAVLYASNDLRYDDYPEPEIKPGHIKINVRACGICGSDIPRVLGNGAHFFPIVLGHEFSGVVAEIGEGVEGFNIGDPVVCAALVPCHKCADCLNGNPSLCKNYTFIGSRIQGGFAEYVVAPAINVVKVAPGTPFELAALTEPATVALHGVQLSDYRGGGTVAVVGAGSIGMFTAQWADILGASKVVYFDIDDDRLALAKEITGFDGVNTLKAGARDAALALTGGVGFDYVFGVSGAPASYHTCFEITANKAHVCFIGTPTGDITFTVKQWEQINRRELMVTGSWMSYSSPFPGKAWTMCAEYLSNGKLKCDKRMIHKIFDLSECKEAFDCYKNPGEVKGRVMIVNNR